MSRRTGGYQAIVMGASAGGLAALSTTLAALPTGLSAPVVLVQHRSPEAGDRLSQLLDRRCRLRVRPAEDKEELRDGQVYVAAPDYHLLVERDRTLSLSVDPKVNHARPSLDVLFESAAEAFCDQLIGIVLTGAGRDGANGLRRVADLGGTAIVQDPATAAVTSMPEAALQAVPDARVVPLEEIGPLIIELCGPCGTSDQSTTGYE